MKDEFRLVTVAQLHGGNASGADLQAEPIATTGY